MFNIIGGYMKLKNICKVLSLLIFLFFFSGCEKFLLEEKKYNEKINIFTMSGNTDGLFASFYNFRGYGKISFAEFNDTLWENPVIEIPPSNNSAAYFGDNLKIDYCKINGQFYEEMNYSNRTHYYLQEPILYFDGTPNIFEWSINNQNYRDSLIYDAPLVNVTSPSFMEEYPKNQDLVVRWEPSDNANDFVMISIQGCPDIIGKDTTYPISYYQYLTEDDGEFVIPSNQLSTFFEKKASLTLSRGTYKISYHSGNKYLFGIYSAHKIDIRLR